MISIYLLPDSQHTKDISFPMKRRDFQSQRIYLLKSKDGTFFLEG